MFRVCEKGELKPLTSNGQGISPFELRIFLLTHSHTMTPFDTPEKTSLLKTLGKGEIACNEQFFLYPQCFLPV